MNGSIVVSSVEGFNHTSIQAILRLTDKFRSKLSPEEDIVFGTCLILAGSFSILGNGSILAVFYSRRRRLSPAEVFLVNLGIVDILLSIASYPCAMISSFHHGWKFGSTGCTIYAFICYFLGLASIVSLTAIAIIRFLKTCSPALGNRINCKTSLKIIFWVYIYSLFWACLPLIGFGSYEVEPFGLSCTLDWTGSGVLSHVHIIMVSFFCIVFPTIIIIFCYTKIILLVRKSDKLVRDKRIRNPNTSVSDSQLTWMSIIVTSGFLLGWLPYTVVSLYGTFTDELMLPMWATPIPVILAKGSIAYNPLIYIFMTKRYREDFMSLFTCVVGTGGREVTRSRAEGQKRMPMVSYDITKVIYSKTTTTTGTSYGTKIEEHPLEMLIVNEPTRTEFSHFNGGIEMDTSNDEDDDEGLT